MIKKLGSQSLVIVINYCMIIMHVCGYNFTVYTKKGSIKASV